MNNVMNHNKLMPPACILLTAYHSRNDNVTTSRRRSPRLIAYYIPLTFVFFLAHQFSISDSSHNGSILSGRWYVSPPSLSLAPLSTPLPTIKLT